MTKEYSTLLGKDEISFLKSCEDGHSGYYWKMLKFLEEFVQTGIGEGRFTEAQAHEDLEIALWYAYACNNIDDYEHYYMATKWMPPSEVNAKGCGTWYYRYACALMYSGKVEKALEYAQKAVQEEEAYPWGWLLLGKLLSHFGDKSGALEAVSRGLILEPGDFEFLTLQKEIHEDRTLEEMEYHYIHPDADQQLQDALLEEADLKKEAIAGICCDRENLERIKLLFQPIDWVADCPYCSFRFNAQGRELEAIFYMNEAAMSKLNLEWLSQQRDKFIEDASLFHREMEGVLCELAAVGFAFGNNMELIYLNPQNNKFQRVRVQENGSAVSTSNPCK